jgi:hypothetical protein
MRDQPLSIVQLNQALARALGVPDTSHCSGLVLTIGAGDLPRVTATFVLRSEDGLRTVVDSWNLAPQRTESAPAVPAEEARDAA